MEPGDLALEGGDLRARARPLAVRDDPDDWFSLGPPRWLPATALQVILMRKDPPFDAGYLYATLLLEQAEAAGVLVLNRPAALRDTNEKLALARYADLAPPTLVTSRADEVRRFLEAHGDIILKPLQGMGGESVFRLRRDDPNLAVVIEIMTARGRMPTMAQRYLPEIAAGDKRILMIDGEPVPRALARMPPAGETRANLAVGGRGVGQALSDRDREICAAIGPDLRRRGLLFVGLDVIGDWLTEVNVTSPTGIRELDAEFGLDIGGQFMDCIEARLK